MSIAPLGLNFIVWQQQLYEILQRRKKVCIALDLIFEFNQLKNVGLVYSETSRIQLSQEKCDALDS